MDLQNDSRIWMHTMTDYLKLKRRIIDYLHKYATTEQLQAISDLLNINTK